MNEKVNAVERRPNLLSQVFESDGRNKIWVGDITYIPTKKGAFHSESRKGNPYDNAVMESFYKTIKRELIQDAHH